MADQDDDSARRALFFATSGDLFVCTDAGGLIGAVNPAWESLFGWRQAELAGLPLAAFFHPQDRLPARFESAVRARLRARDGGFRLVELLPTGDPHCAIGRDLSAAEVAARALRADASRERVAAAARFAAQRAVGGILADAPPLPEAIPLLLAAIAEPLGFPLATLWLGQPDGRLRAACTWCAPTFHASAFIETTRRGALGPHEDPAGTAWVTGAPRHVTGGVPLTSPRAPLARALGLATALAVPLAGATGPLGALELLAPATGAHAVQAEADLVPLVDSLGGQLARFLVREHRRAARADERALEAELLDGARAAMLAVDAEFRVLGMNRAAEALFGRPRSAAVGTPLADVILPHGRRETWRERLAAYLASPEARAGRPLELEGRRADGSPFPLELALTVVREQPLVLLAHGADVTESRRLVEQVQRWQRADSVGRLAAGLVHDLNNQLTVITGHAELLLENLPRSAHLGEEVVAIRSAGERAMLLTRQLASFAGQEAASPVLVSLNDIVAGMEMMLRRVIGEGMQLETQLDGDVGQVHVDPSHVQQVLLNLAIRARDASQGRGGLLLRTRHARVAESYAPAHPELAAGAYAVLAVEDGGPGMDAGALAALFGPISASVPGEPPSLELATVRSIARGYAGQVTATSDPERGSRFEIWLPEVIAPAASGPAEDLKDAGPKALPGGTILLVEDDSGLRTVCRMILEEEGHSVLDAATPQVALRRAREHAGPLDLLVADVVLPGMSGVELARRLRAERPGLKVLYMSGHLDNAMVRELEHDGGGAFLPKPFLPGALASKVRAALLE